MSFQGPSAEALGGSILNVLASCESTHTTDGGEAQLGSCVSSTNDGAEVKLITEVEDLSRLVLGLGLTAGCWRKCKEAICKSTNHG